MLASHVLHNAQIALSGAVLRRNQGEFRGIFALGEPLDCTRAVILKATFGREIGA